jgi:hypothetical protein
VMILDLDSDRREFFLCCRIYLHDRDEVKLGQREHNQCC